MSVRRLFTWLAFPLVVAAVWLTLVPSGSGGFTSYVMVEGSSMEPLLYTGDLAVTSGLSGHDAGDLVVFDIGAGSLVIHRLVERAANGEWITQGDNKPSADPWTVPDSAILGSYVFAVPGAGEWVAWLKDRPLAVAFFAGLFAMALYLPLGRLLPHRWRSAKAEREAVSAVDSAERMVIALALAGAAACGAALVVMVRQGATETPMSVIVLALAIISGLAGAVLLVSHVARRSDRSGAQRPSGVPESVEDLVTSAASSTTTQTVTQAVGATHAVTGRASGASALLDDAREPAGMSVCPPDDLTTTNPVTFPRDLRPPGSGPAPGPGPASPPTSVPTFTPQSQSSGALVQSQVNAKEIDALEPDQGTLDPMDAPENPQGSAEPELEGTSTTDDLSNDATQTDTAERREDAPPPDSTDAQIPDGGLPTVAMGALKRAQVKALRAKQARGLPPAVISLISSGSARMLRPKVVAAFTPDQVAALRPAAVRALKPSVITRLEPEQIAAVEASTFDRVKPEQYAVLRPHQMMLLAPGTLHHIPPAGLRAMRPKTVAALSPEQVAGLRPASVARMRSAQLRRLSKEQVAALTSRQVAALSPRKRTLLGL